MAHSNLKRFVLFRKTPVSKALFILCGLSTLWGFYLHPPNEAIRDSALLCCSSSGGLLHWRRVYEGRRLGELLRTQIGFKNWWDLCSGLYLFCSVQDLERQLGGRKFGSWCFMVVSFSTAMMIGFGLISPSLCIRARPGPFHLLGALTTAFCAYVPVLPTRVTRVSDTFKFLVTNKTVTYLVAVHLAMKGGWSSILPSLAGILSALICAKKPFKEFLLPKFICRFLGVLHPLLKSREEHNEDARKRMEAQVDIGNGEQEQRQRGGRVYEALLPPLNQDIPRLEWERRIGGGTGMTGPYQRRRTAPIGSNAASSPPVTAPSEEAIATLVSMGFTRDESLRALRETRNNVEAAVNKLLG
eukprot:481690_1